MPASRAAPDVETRGLDVVVVGGANTDFLVRGSALPKPGATVRGDAFCEAPGGKGANQAVAAARLGAAVAFVGRVGADERGVALLAALEAEGVDVRDVSVDPLAPTGVALVMVDAHGEKQILTAPGANLRLGRREVARAAGRIARAHVVLLQLEVSLDATAAAIRLARRAGRCVVLDPAPPRELSDELLREVDVLRPNADEAEALTGTHVAGEASARRAAHKLLRRGVGAAVVGAPGGNLVVSRRWDAWIPHIPVREVDATGAGDAFAAALAVCIAREEDLLGAACFAGAAAALATTRLGAQAALPEASEVAELLESQRAGARTPACGGFYIRRA